MMLFFDYVYYRTYRYFRNRGDVAPETMGTIMLSLVQCFTLLDIMIIGKMIYDYPLPSKYVFLLLLFIVGIYNWLRYERKFNSDEIENRWKLDTPKDWEKRGRYIGLYMVMALILPLAYGILKHNLNGT